jgi:hypothetical protein
LIQINAHDVGISHFCTKKFVHGFVQLFWNTAMRILLQILLLCTLCSISPFSTQRLSAQAQSSEQTFSEHELSINAFRNPSIGLEYRFHQVSIHLGYYVTNFEPNVTTQFLKAGLSYWFLPMRIAEAKHPSSFYVQASYLRGLNLEYENANALALDVGFRWMIWEGLQLRLGVTELADPDRSLKINPTPSLNYSFFF